MNREGTAGRKSCLREGGEPVSFFRALAARAAERYRKMSIQMVLSLSFTAATAVKDRESTI